MIEVWPDNERALGIFARIGTRWQMNPMGGLPHGLRWEAIYPLMDRLELAGTDWDSLLNDLELMESVALKTMAEFAPPPPKPKK